MDVQRLWCLLLLPMFSHLDSKETIVKTVWTDSDITPICTNDTLNIINFIICKIRTERNGEECLLSYKDRGFVHNCSSGFRLLTENQSVSLHLTNLTPEDSGNYTCQCSHTDGVYIRHLSLTVKDANSHLPVIRRSYIILIAVSVFVLVTGVIAAYILCRKCCRDDTRSEESETSAPESSCSSNQDDQEDSDDPYESLQQPASDVYHTISLERLTRDTERNNDTEPKHLDDLDTDDGETEERHEIYENL